MLNYYHQKVSSSGIVYSVDNVRINFLVNPRYRDDFEKYLSSDLRTDIKRYPVNTSDFKFKYLFQVFYPGQDNNLHSLTIGYIFNGSSGHADVEKGYLDFNPNKIGSNRQFWADFAYLKRCCYDWSIARIDVAMDIPTKRQFVYLEKDGRKYALDAYSFENKTEYLGLRSHVGYVKLYNKTLESKLDYDLTRLEITCEPSVSSFTSCFPHVWDISQAGQLDMEIMSLSNSDLAFVRMCLACQQSGSDPGMMIFNSLSWHKKQKLRKFVTPESCLVSIDGVCVTDIFCDVIKLYA